MGHSLCMIARGVRPCRQHATKGEDSVSLAVPSRQRRRSPLFAHLDVYDSCHGVGGQETGAWGMPDGPRGAVCWANSKRSSQRTVSCPFGLPCLADSCAAVQLARFLPLPIPPAALAKP